MTYFLLAMTFPLALLAWSGRLVAATSEQARRSLRDAGIDPAAPPPSVVGVVVSGLVVLAALAAATLLTL